MTEKPPADRARAFAESLSMGDAEYLLRQVRTRVRKDSKSARRGGPPGGGRDANAWKVQKGQALDRALVELLGYDPDKGTGKPHRGHGQPSVARVATATPKAVGG